MGTTYLVAVYRPPKTNKLRFIEELRSLFHGLQQEKHLVLIGDTNINILDGVNSAISTKYKDTLCDLGLQCGISDVTREEIVKNKIVLSCIDHMWVRDYSNQGESSSYVLRAGKISDHYLIGGCLSPCQSASFSIKNSCAERCILDNKTIEEKLFQIEWEKLVEIDCPVLLYNKLCDIFCDVYENSKKYVKYVNRRITKPWITKNLYKMIKKRDLLFKKWKKSPGNMTLRLEYTKHRNKTNKKINIAKNIYRKKVIDDCKGDYRKIWQNINKWMGKRKCNIDETILQHLGRDCSITDICNNFTKTFTQEIDNIKHKCNVNFLDRNSYVDTCNVSFRFQPITASCVEKIIDKMSINKSPGSDKIRIQDLKLIKCKISPVIAHFINVSVKKGIYPDQLKLSLIRPIFKQGSHTDYSNYRPIAILSVINKITEKAIVAQVTKFLEKHEILSSNQYGFRRNHSTTSALSKFTNDINEYLHNKNQVLAIFIDYKKAFDTLDHDLLIRAMNECGIRGPMSEWFRCYLNNRKMQTVVDNNHSHAEQIKYGVPTGSVYGPIGYIMHVNSVSNVVQNCKVYMYADDMCILSAGKDLKAINSKIQDDFNSITKWAHDNGIILNIKKTKCMYIHSPYNGKDSQSLQVIGHSYDCLHNRLAHCKCDALEFVKQYKYLGLTIDTNMSWKTHIKEVCKKLRCILGKFYYLSGIVSRSTLLSVYYALFDSVVSYGLSSYGHTFKTYLDEIKSLQIRCSKFLVDKKTKLSCNHEYDKLFNICKILPIHEKVKYVTHIENINNVKSLDCVSHKIQT
ncbi:hypothetical protein JYU34_013767 [Plutella xylostella]|uniref:Reverse transcriptase domain-containing protein n=1 Tax=Plutella xylostella TaxID=51655 RepID=A0ABQ7QE84_PLUXY|nr:hypothetical protein JYU34_013767 [Plutella xylostella]